MKTVSMNRDAESSNSFHAQITRLKKTWCWTAKKTERGGVMYVAFTDFEKEENPTQS